MAKPQVALQLYSVREDCTRDFAGTLQAVAAMGYEGVEFAGYHDWSAADLRRALDDLGLQAAGTHIGIATLLGEALEPTVEYNRAIGNRFLIVPGLPAEYTESAEAWRRTAELFNEIAEQVAPAGMLVGYHNHTHEFHELDGEVPWDIFFGGTRPEVVMQFDTGNAMHGGGEAAPYLRAYPGRALTVHVKEYSASNPDALLGEGDLPWEEILGLCETIGGTEWYIIEQESYPYPPLECVERCLDSLRAMGR